MGCTHSSPAAPQSTSTDDAIVAVPAGARRASLGDQASALVRSLVRRISQRPEPAYADHLFQPLEPVDNQQDLVTGESQLKVCLALKTR